MFMCVGKGERHQPACMIAHNLVNKLAAIVGHSDLLIEKTTPGTEYAARLTVIRDIAESAAKELGRHQLETPPCASGSTLTRHRPKAG
jgi:hypothetical protein